MSHNISADEVKRLLDEGRDFEDLNQESGVFEHFIEETYLVLFSVAASETESIACDSLTHRYHVMGNGDGLLTVVDWMDADDVPEKFRDDDVDYDSGYRVSVFEMDKHDFEESEAYIRWSSNPDYSVNPRDIVEHHQALHEKEVLDSYSLEEGINEEVEKFYC